MKTTLYFVRHGQSVANLEGRYAGHQDFLLTPLGKEQAGRTANLLADVPFDAILVSDLTRAVQTATPIAESHQLPIQTDPELRELFFGELEGVKVVEYAKIDPTFLQDWVDDFPHMCPPGGESIAELIVRAKRVCDRIATAYLGKTVCVVTHGAMLRALCCVWNGAVLETIQQTPWASNASVSCVEWEDGNYRILSYSLDDHIADIRTVVQSAELLEELDAL